MLRVAVATALVACAPALALAGQPDFVGSLSDADAKACGLAHLTTAQKAEIDRLAMRDITLAREGGVSAFSASFVSRRSDTERMASGITSLNQTERDNLDAAVASAIAYHPMTYQAQAAATAPAPKAAPVAQTWSLPPPKWDIHGDVSLTIGGGSHGSSFYGAGMDVYATDPSGRFTLGVGVAEFHAKGYYLPPCLWLP